MRDRERYGERERERERERQREREREKSSIRVTIKLVGDRRRTWVVQAKNSKRHSSRHGAETVVIKEVVREVVRMSSDSRDKTSGGDGQRSISEAAARTAVGAEHIRDRVCSLHANPIVVNNRFLSFFLVDRGW